MRADVIVVGLGSMGAATVCDLAGRGIRVIGLDQLRPPHDRGAHGGGSRIIRMAYMEGADYVPLVRRSYELWQDLSAMTATDLITTTGGLMFGHHESKAVAGALATARAERLPHELLDAAEIRRRFPAFTPADHEVGLYEEIAGYIRPERAIDAYLALAEERGADLRRGVPVLAWRAERGGVRVATPDGDLTADHLVLAPGAWAPDFIQLEVPMRVERRLQHYWRPAEPAGYEPGRLPVWIWGYDATQSAYGLPSVGGEVKAAMHHRDGGDETVDPDQGAAAARPEEIAEMRDWLSTHLPALASGEWLGAKPCLYTLTPDEHFVLGPHPEYDNVSVACGFSGHGFKFAPVVGEVLADLATTGTTTHQIATFDPARFAAAA